MFAASAFGAAEAELRKAFEAKTGLVVLPAGDFTLTREILIEGAHDLRSAARVRGFARPSRLTAGR